MGKKSAFLGQNGQEMHYYMIGIANYTELNLQICKYAQNDESYMAIFTLAERLPTSATLIGPQFSNGFEIRLRHKIHLFPVSSSAK